MSYTTEWQQHGVYWRYLGCVNGAELIKSNLEIYGDERFDAMKFQIVDMTGVSEFKVTRDEILKIAAYDKAAALSNPWVKVAIITKTTSIKNLSELYEAANIESPWETRVFDSIDAALQWIDAGSAG